MPHLFNCCAVGWQVFAGTLGRLNVAVKELLFDKTDEESLESAMSEAQLLWQLRHVRAAVELLCARPLYRVV
jgi:hypothetical protein